MTTTVLNQRISEQFNRRNHVLVGRGTTALWLALRALARRDGQGEVILPDIICDIVLDGVLLAGFIPVWAAVSPDRFMLSPDSVAALVTPRTRAILVAHTFGYLADVDAIRAAAPGVPIIEDTVQGLGGHSAGLRGDLSFISFDPQKMIGGRGGVLLYDDDSLDEGIAADIQRLADRPAIDPLDALRQVLPPPAAAGYATQLRVRTSALLRPFDPSPLNVNRILDDWATLDARVRDRNMKARYLHTHLAAWNPPAIKDGDAIWRYTFAASTPALARRILWNLQQAGITATGLYYPLSRLFGQPTPSAALANRLVNLWVDNTVTETDLQRTVDVIRGSRW
ncbi:MAG: DegT/DnrJ/EryC1/StrS aminotransferase family protein [Anaerolineae bacterium]|nr:DegT/DnrJ/EryC1/StrS aminotransferase family protein [Anaerolineae bacterium]